MKPFGRFGKLTTSKLRMNSTKAVVLSAAFAVIAAGLFAWQYFGWFQSKISAVSDVSGISLKLVLPDKLNEYLSDWGFWEEEGVLFWSEEKLVTVKRLVIHLTDKEQPYNQFTNGEGKVTYATGERYDPGGTYHLFVFFTDFYLGRIPTEEGPWKVLEGLALQHLVIASIDDPVLPEDLREAKIVGGRRAVNDIMDLEERIFKVKRVQ